MKSILLLANCYSPPELEPQIELFVEACSHHRYHEAPNNVTPGHLYYGRGGRALKKRVQVRRKTMLLRPGRTVVWDLC